MKGKAARNPTHNRYPVRMIVMAQEMYGDGEAWTPTEIRRYLAERCDGPIPHENTIRRWVIPGLADEQRHANSSAAQKRQQADRRPRRLSDGALEQKMLMLRRAGLTYSAVAVVLDLYHDAGLSAEQVRARLRGLGVPRSEAKSAATRRLWAETNIYRPASVAP